MTRANLTLAPMGQQEPPTRLPVSRVEGTARLGEAKLCLDATRLPTVDDRDGLHRA